MTWQGMGIYTLVFSKVGDPPVEMGTFWGIRAAAAAARRMLSRYGTPVRDRNEPSGTDALWGVRGSDSYGVHAYRV